MWQEDKKEGASVHRDKGKALDYTRGRYVSRLILTGRRAASSPANHYKNGK